MTSWNKGLKRSHRIKFYVVFFALTWYNVIIMKKVIIKDENNYEKVIPKRGSIFVFELPNGEKIEINGDILSIRPEDRIKKRFKKI